MHICLTNDDGLSAYGLRVLEQIANHFADEVSIVAPAANQSGTGRSLSLHKDIRYQQLSENSYQVEGTPADCMMMAMNVLFADKKPDLVLSGVNHGMNVGDDVGYSGTIGAAFEAAIHGVPAIALSQRDGRSDDAFGPAISAGIQSVEYALSVSMAHRTILNINFPSAKLGEPEGIRPAILDTHKFCDEILPGDTENSFRIGPLVMTDEVLENSDRYWIEKGFVSITALKMDINDTAQTQKIAGFDFGA